MEVVNLLPITQYSDEGQCVTKTAIKKKKKSASTQIRL